MRRSRGVSDRGVWQGLVRVSQAEDLLEQLKQEAELAKSIAEEEDEF